MSNNLIFAYTQFPNRFWRIHEYNIVGCFSDMFIMLLDRK